MGAGPASGRPPARPPFAVQPPAATRASRHRRTRLAGGAPSCGGALGGPSRISSMTLKTHLKFAPMPALPWSRPCAALEREPARDAHPGDRAAACGGLRPEARGAEALSSRALGLRGARALATTRPLPQATGQPRAAHGGRARPSSNALTSAGPIPASSCGRRQRCSPVEERGLPWGT